MSDTDAGTGIISDIPLLKSGSLTITTPGEYEDLLVVDCDPTAVFYLRDLIVLFDWTGLVDPLPMMTISINGLPYIKDHHSLIADGMFFSFGGQLKLWNSRGNNRRVLTIQVKSTVPLVTLYAEAYVNGIEVKNADGKEL